MTTCFNLFSTWQCPHCLQSYCTRTGQTAETIVFLRGTCHHDVCVKCIADLSSRVGNRVKREETTGYEQPIITLVTCPIVIVGHQCRGQFEVDATKIVKYRRGIGTSTSTSTSSADDNEIIDLCNDEDGPKNAPIIKEEAVNPRPIIVNVKSEPNGYDDETIDHREDLSDLLDDCESKKDEKNEECQIVKRRRLDPSLEATVQCNEFWSVNEDHIQFTEQAFVKKAIFHINFF